MRRLVPHILPVLAVIAPLLLGSGCTTGTVQEGSTDPGTNEAAIGSDPQHDADLISSMYDGHLLLSAQGVVRAEAGVGYDDRLAYRLPDAGADLLDGFIHHDRDGGLGLGEGYYTEGSVYRLHKDASVNGWLDVDTSGQKLAIRLARRDVGSIAATTVWINGLPVDPGRPDVACDYVVIVAPGGLPAGTGSQRYSGLRFVYKSPD